MAPKEIQALLSATRKVRKKLHTQKNILLFRGDWLRRHGAAKATAKENDIGNWVEGGGH